MQQGGDAKGMYSGARATYRCVSVATPRRPNAVFKLRRRGAGALDTTGAVRAFVSLNRLTAAHGCSARRSAGILGRGVLEALPELVVRVAAREPGKLTEHAIAEPLAERPRSTISQPHIIAP